MFSNHFFGCSFTAGCFVSKCLFNLLGTSASFDGIGLQIRQNGNESSSGLKDMKPYSMSSSLYLCLVRCFLCNAFTASYLLTYFSMGNNEYCLLITLDYKVYAYNVIYILLFG